MAPEQTGRMNRSIDSRSDLYSLGVSLYEILTGNGCGMTSSAEIGKGFGFVNMRARVKKLNGELEIRSAPGRGTTILVIVPVQGWRKAVSFFPSS